MKNVLKIDPKRFYSLYEIVKDGIIPGVDRIPKASYLVRNDMLRKKILKAKIVKRGELGVQYKVKGENIIKYLKELKK